MSVAWLRSALLDELAAAFAVVPVPAAEELLPLLLLLELPQALNAIVSATAPLATGSRKRCRSVISLSSIGSILAIVTDSTSNCIHFYKENQVLVS
jgi:hypothetical protein